MELITTKCSFTQNGRSSVTHPRRVELEAIGHKRNYTSALIVWAILDRSLGQVHALPRHQFCMTCGEELPYSDFYRDATYRNGRKSECIPCYKANRRQRYARTGS